MVELVSLLLWYFFPILLSHCNDKLFESREKSFLDSEGLDYLILLFEITEKCLSALKYVTSLSKFKTNTSKLIAEI